MDPGVYVEEVPGGVRTVTGVSTADAAFVDVFARGPLDEPVRVTSFTDFESVFGGLDRGSEASYAVRQFFLNGGRAAWVVRVASADAAALLGTAEANTGLHALNAITAGAFNLLCLPAAAELDAASARAVYAAAGALCRERLAFLLIDIPSGVTTPTRMLAWLTANATLRTDFAAVYFPRVLVADPLDGNRPRNVGPSGTLAGVYARTDATSGVWKAPSGAEAVLLGAAPAVRINDRENGTLNPHAVNALRYFPALGNVAWGARTLVGDDQQASEWKYVPVRRLALFIEASLVRGLQWAVFEPNDEPLWAQVRLTVGAFLHDLFRRGAFRGNTPRDAYFVKCDAGTTTQADIYRGVFNVVVGFAPLKPAEFVVITIQQLAAQPGPCPGAEP